MEVGACSHIGMVRDVNQDAYYICDGDLNLFIIADGMGGHNAGEVASQISIDTIKEYILEKIKKDGSISDENINMIVREAIIYANHVVFSKSQEKIEYQGMGTTLTVVLILSKIYIGHVGDSRAYLLQGDRIIQITQDHSLVAELLKNGSITESEAKIHPQRNIITRALGTEENITVDLYTLDAKSGEVIVLCTDGLSNLVNPNEIKDAITHDLTLQNACESLVSLANERGGYDNITVIAAKIKH